MSEQQQVNYQRVAEAIDFIRHNFKRQPDLDEVAKKVFLSPFHFQKLFSEWAGVSPKKFLQYVSIEHAKDILKNTQASLFEAAHETGLSGTSRLHDLFVNIEGMTPGEYKNGGENLRIQFSFAESQFGSLLVASTPKGICHIAFADDENQALEALRAQFPRASFHQITDLMQQNALQIFRQDWWQLETVKLHLKGTPFQIKVWETLLKIPLGGLSTYGKIAEQIQIPGASRAVGTAIGSNPVAFIIPCHRVIKSAGEFGNYHWGTTRKTAMLGWEFSQIQSQ
jgi:AraC family transcriptional regulator, regulatory protein of adaptative response / methylated-DNA-[protein]-cysteine methyltransferase